VAFAEVEKFLDTPVKRYSSGMYVRLAFAVAAHLEPEILIVDEVLAVGDAQFQKKCLGKMEDVGKEGRTVLFVSHNLSAIAGLCGRVALLKDGKLVEYSNNLERVLNKYLEKDYINSFSTLWKNTGQKFDNPYFKPLTFSLIDASGKCLPPEINKFQEIWIQIEGEVRKPNQSLVIGYSIYTEKDEIILWSCNTDTSPTHWIFLTSGLWTLKTKLPNHLLNEGYYRIELIGGLFNQDWLFKPESYDITLKVNIQGKMSDSPYFTVRRPALLAPIIQWEALKEIEPI